MMSLHLLRPWWLLLLIPFVFLIWRVYCFKPGLDAWAAICDSPLFSNLVAEQGRQRQWSPFVWLLSALFFLILAMTGPTWSKLPVPAYQPLQPRVIVLDMSDDMLENDLSPNRLARARFKLRDLLAHKESGQFGMVVYTGEPFVVSPLTDDGQTIAALLPMLNPEIMPVSGSNLAAALGEAAQLIKQAGYAKGEILILTGDAPDQQAISAASKLAGRGVKISVLPMTAASVISPQFRRLAQAGKGSLIPLQASSADLDQWLQESQKDQTLALAKEDDLPLWRDQGPWFLIPALCLLLPVFRRGWLQRISL